MNVIEKKRKFLSKDLPEDSSLSHSRTGTNRRRIGRTKYTHRNKLLSAYSQESFINDVLDRAVMSSLYIFLHILHILHTGIFKLSIFNNSLLAFSLFRLVCSISLSPVDEINK